MFSLSTTRVRKQCILPGCPNRPLDNRLCDAHNQEHLSAQQQIYRVKRQRNTTKYKYKGNKISKKMKKEKLPIPSHIQAKRKHIPISTKEISKCMFHKCMFLVDRLHRCKYHDTFKKCMFPGCYNEKQKNSGKCKTHNHFKLCRKKHCYIYDGIGDYCRIHT